MTQYLISVWHADPTEVPVYESDEQAQEAYKQTGAFTDKMRAAGTWVFVGGLQPLDTATTVDGTDGQNLVVDGPYIESKENLGGFWVLECADRDEALALAREASEACMAKVEVRPFQGESPSE